MMMSPKNQFFIKLAFALLLLGFACHLLFFRSVEYSPVETPVIDKSADEITQSAVVLPDNEDVIPQDIEIEKCDLFNGKWVVNPSGPTYTNETCLIMDSHQNCVTNGRPDSGYLYWKWQPRDCLLPGFDARRFLEIMRNKAWALIGDSISRNHVQSLLCMLSVVEQPVEVYHDEEYRSKRWHFPSHNFTISNIWSPFLVEAAIFEDSDGVSTSEVKLQLDKLDKTWTELYQSLDYMIISTGKWFLKAAIYYENGEPIGCHSCSRKNLTELGFVYAYNRTLHYVMDFIARSNHKGLIFFRTSTPDHFENGEWHNGGTCKRTEPTKEDEAVDLKEANKILKDVELNEFENAVEEAIKNGVNLKLLDFTSLLLTRPDGHPGPYRQYRPFDEDENAKVQNDCLHWCLPGPIDYLNDVIMEMIVRGG